MVTVIASGIFALLGAAVGALASYFTQSRALAGTRRSQVVDTRFRTAAEFLARAQEICTEYRMLDIHYRDFELRFNPAQREERVDKAFNRGLDAWLEYRNAHAQMMVNPPSEEIRDKGEVVHDKIDRWVNAIDADYFGISVSAYEADYDYADDAGTKRDREKAVIQALGEYEAAARRRAPD